MGVTEESPFDLGGVSVLQQSPRIAIRWSLGGSGFVAAAVIAALGATVALGSPYRGTFLGDWAAAWAALFVEPTVSVALDPCRYHAPQAEELRISLGGLRPTLANGRERFVTWPLSRPGIVLAVRRDSAAGAQTRTTVYPTDAGRMPWKCGDV